MTKKRIKTKEGDIFAVPLTQGGYVIGLIAREHNGLTLGYFFDKIYTSVPNQVELTDLHNWRVLLVAKFSPQGIEKGEWPLLKTQWVFDRNTWPIPVFKMQEPISRKFFGVIYDDTLINENRYLITAEEAESLFSHGLHGHGVIEGKLSRLVRH